MLSSGHIQERLTSAAREVGFDVAGVAPAGEFAELAYFPEWIAQGCAGEMRYLESRDESGTLKRASLANSAPWARSVVVCAKNYNTRQPASTEPAPRGQGWISRYAWGSADYHDVLLPALRRLEACVREMGAERTWCYVDTGPLIERVFAKHSGVGWMGKNTCIINQKLGSWMFLGVILTSLELPPNLPAADRCGTCRRCIDACPTHAFIEPYKLDASRCISYVTIEKRGAIPEELREGVGRQVFGCDICQDVCPWNRRAPVTAAPEFQPRSGLVNPALEWLATMKEEEFRMTFRGSPIRRAKRSGLRRNAVVSIGNSGDRRFIPLLERLSSDQDEIVAEHARWALEKLTRA
jgi:epoxyqueuosine reductase